MTKAIIVNSKDNSQRKLFRTPQELANALCSHQIPFIPVIEDVNFTNCQFEQSEEDSEKADLASENALLSILEKAQSGAYDKNELLQMYDNMYNSEKSDPIEAVFKNCKFDKASAFCDMDIEAHNCSFSGFYIEGADLDLKGTDNTFTKMSINEGDLSLDVKNCDFSNAGFYKTHVSGKMEDCTCFSLEGRVWLGQNDNLVMKNVDFGNKPIDPDYFWSENLSLINPKMNPETLESVKQQYPHTLKEQNTGMHQQHSHHR